VIKTVQGSEWKMNFTINVIAVSWSIECSVTKIVTTIAGSVKVGQ